MKFYSTMLKTIFFRKILLSLSICALFFMLGYTIFNTTRAVCSTTEGLQEVSKLNQPETLISNLDPESTVEIDRIDPKALQEVYDYLGDHFDYALYTDGLIVNLPNSHDMEVSLSYANATYLQLNPFRLSEGKNVHFDYKLDASDAIPVLIGKGLSETYPIGSTLTFVDPARDQEVTYKVQGVLEENAAHSNFYAVNSKQYYNFSIVVPVNQAFINASNENLKVNALMDLILPHTNKQEASALGEYIEKRTGLKFNFYTQEENLAYFDTYFVSSITFITLICIVISGIIIGLSVWNMLVGIRSLIKDITIHMLVGMDYQQLRHLLYAYFGLLVSFTNIALFCLTVYSRYGSWLRRETLFTTLGFLHLIPMDWMALGTALLAHIILSILIVEITLWYIKRIPISIGVLR